ncbi:hypothetical protein COT66_01235 [Candidatus Shapirobacteria bacterium CG09_land_8_20_14_0_10_49_15]|uniref:PsbP C-terminal domain-containing protein n=2 Tax=Candidatus Shapironibacteriota TaxID=1752721 RepID=A0A2M8L6I9_9BACT|nr:MAG: hypothetical protein COT66_01235 [Candidatus Shapirobacteria bacterium CG09_land_8_20_14_0_10_49_15]PJE69827.1 MAG: hypothetical protein COU97_03040 [Candidatus Shapirobacteria bacterium CG10_big_fil_rev_8_21_14_0_10_48_15]
MELLASQSVKPLPLPPNPKNRSVIALAGLLVAFLAISLYLSIQNYQLKDKICGLEEQIKFSPKVSAPQPTPTPDPAVDWQVYRNEEYGYELKYPDELTLGKGDNWMSLRNFAGSYPEDENYINFAVSVEENPEGLSLQEFLDRENRDRRSLVDEQKELEVGVEKIPAIWMTFREEVNAGKPRVYFVHGQFFFSSHIDYGSLIKVEALKIFDQILSTFRFLD